MNKYQCLDCQALYPEHYGDICQHCGGNIVRLNNITLTSQHEEKNVTQNNADETARTFKDNEDDNLADAFSSFLGKNKINIKNKIISETESEAIETNKFAKESILPRDIVQQGWRIQGNPLPGTKGYEEWLIEKQSESGAETHAIFRRFTTGSLTTKKTYDAISSQTASGYQNNLVKLYSYGTVQMGGGARADYEIVGLPIGKPLNVWLKDKGQPGVEPTRYLLKPLVDVLENLRKLGIAAITLSPQMLWLSEDGQISLAVLGSLAMREEVTDANFCADLSSSALLSFPYMAPEIPGRRVVTSNCDVFSLGQILSECLFGEPQDHAYITKGNLPFAMIEDKTLRNILMGALWPENEERWTVDDLIKVVNADGSDMPALPSWSSLLPGAAKTAFTLGSIDYFLPEDLLEGADKHWDEAILRLDELFQWLKGTRYDGQSQMILKIKNEGNRSADWALLKLRMLILPDAPLVWRGLLLDNEHAHASLMQLAQIALKEGHEAKHAQELLKLLFAADLRGAFTPLS